MLEINRWQIYKKHLDEICAGYDILNMNGFFHMDSRCSNLVLVGETFKIIDFGLSTSTLKEKNFGIVDSIYFLKFEYYIRSTTDYKNDELLKIISEEFSKYPESLTQKVTDLKDFFEFGKIQQKSTIIPKPIMRDVGKYKVEEDCFINENYTLSKKDRNFENLYDRIDVFAATKNKEAVAVKLDFCDKNQGSEEKQATKNKLFFDAMPTFVVEPKELESCRVFEKNLNNNEWTESDKVKMCFDFTQRGIMSFKTKIKDYTDKVGEYKTDITNIVKNYNALNEKGFLHRDAKSENLILFDNGLKIFDFSKSRTATENGKIDLGYSDSLYFLVNEYIERENDPELIRVIKKTFKEFKIAEKTAALENLTKKLLYYGPKYERNYNFKDGLNLCPERFFEIYKALKDAEPKTGGASKTGAGSASKSGAVGASQNEKRVVSLIKNTRADKCWIDSALTLIFNFDTGLTLRNTVKVDAYNESENRYVIMDESTEEYLNRISVKTFEKKNSENIDIRTEVRDTKDYISTNQQELKTVIDLGWTHDKLRKILGTFLLVSNSTLKERKFEECKKLKLSSSQDVRQMISNCTTKLTPDWNQSNVLQYSKREFNYRQGGFNDPADFLQQVLEPTIQKMYYMGNDFVRKEEEQPCIFFNENFSFNKENLELKFNRRAAKSDGEYHVFESIKGKNEIIPDILVTFNQPQFGKNGYFILEDYNSKNTVNSNDIQKIMLDYGGRKYFLQSFINYIGQAHYTCLYKNKETWYVADDMKDSIELAVFDNHVNAPIILRFVHESFYSNS